MDFVLREPKKQRLFERSSVPAPLSIHQEEEQTAYNLFRIDIMKHLNEQKEPKGKALIQEQHKYLIL